MSEELEVEEVVEDNSNLIINDEEAEEVDNASTEASEESEDVEDVEEDAEAEDSEEDVEPGYVDIDQKVQFDAKQQAEVDRIIKTRLDRQEGKFLKDMCDVAGVDLESSEVSKAARLWGLLKANGELSDAVNQVIDQHLSSGKAKPPTQNRVLDSRESELALKEAKLDLKLSDNLFNKHSEKILQWAEDQGFSVTDAKTLKLAYMAWKGSQGKLLEATKKLNEQKKQVTKEATRKKASVQSSKSSKGKPVTDFTKLSDADVLSHSGLSLFVEE